MRSLEAILEGLLTQVDGAAVAGVGGMDGLVVEQRPESRNASANAAADGGVPDVAVCVAELTTTLAGARRAVADALAGGPIEALHVRSEARLVLVRHVTAQHYLLLVASPATDEGRAAGALAEAAAQVRELVA